ncbi:MAG TPA: ATP-binding cassette domain-containing protein [Bacteroidia bacterium]|jgi:ABC-2 type transport system ATP-binding protein|nr:ATP-binding cassette domain-containing protein [Bacteroidia bacterium]HMU19669.1 ATP-binding cassette domain-containing protein [Bacteroidia bacterium]
MNLLSIREVTKIYANHKALDSVSIEIPESSVFGLLGPNGAGKTSLIRIINQITGPDGGSILFGGQTLNPSHISAIGYLPEERGLYKKMEVGEQAIYLARLKGLSRSDALKKLRYWFEKFEMQSWWRKKVEELSKGMQQKVQFIVTILHEPRLLILDEPFTGFDPINANLIKDELLGLRQKGATIILSTHRMESVEELCTHIALINKSKKILDGQVKDVRKQFRSNLFEIEYKGTSVGFANALWTGFELVETRTQDDHAFAVVKNLNNSSANDLLRQLLNDVELISFRERIPTMNDIFIESVQNNKPVEA